MKRTIKQSLIFSFVVNVLYLVCTIGYGFIKTIYYVPDVVDGYQDVEYLQNEISFGVISSPLTPIQFGIVSFLIMSVLFILIKIVIVKIR
ncbi:hypothetical protein J2Z37_001995 [Ammoniphilus resinae]|uniref:DUF4306 domain-containing protein n=1 Tax=Ammoniphilus resinae TaxID=861532 RepID=A0ABS4GNZ0_9BACL|nr:hypothetical protein [Ammoniphilus resinae]